VEEPIPLERMMEKLRLYKLANPTCRRFCAQTPLRQVVKVLDGIKRVPVGHLALATEVQ
jgi:hypothetical protein